MKILFAIAALLSASVSAQAYVVECANQDKSFEVMIFSNDEVKVLVTDKKSADADSVLYKDCALGLLGSDDNVVSSFACKSSKAGANSLVKVYFFDRSQTVQYENLKTGQVEFNLKCNIKPN